MPLSEEEYAPGRRVRDPEGNDVDVQDVVTGASGNRYLVVTHPNSGFGALVAVGTVRDEWEARDPDEVTQEREQEAQGPGTDPGVTDAPDVTGDRQDAPSSGNQQEQTYRPTSGQDTPEA